MYPVTIGVLALQGGVIEHTRVLEYLGAKVVQIRTSSQLESIDGLILPGGESSAMTRIMEKTDLAQSIAHKLASGLPCFGTCAGMVLLADTLHPPEDTITTFSAIDMVVQRNAFGRQIDSRKMFLEFGDTVKEQISAVFIRAPQVVSVGKTVQILARVSIPHGDNEHYHDAIVAVRQGNCLASAFHPELTNEVKVHRYFLTMMI